MLGLTKLTCIRAGGCQNANSLFIILFLLIFNAILLFLRCSSPPKYCGKLELIIEETSGLRLIVFKPVLIYGIQVCIRQMITLLLSSQNPSFQNLPQS